VIKAPIGALFVFGADMDLYVKRALDGSLHIDCGDEQRALGIWLEQEWAAPGFQDKLREALRLGHADKPWTIQGREFTCQHQQGVVEIERHGGFDEATELALELDQDLELADSYASCGFEDFVQLIEGITSF
jgi:uncharacterized protein YacL (UPF0231 family)